METNITKHMTVYLTLSLRRTFWRLEEEEKNDKNSPSLHEYITANDNSDAEDEEDKLEDKLTQGIVQEVGSRGEERQEEPVVTGAQPNKEHGGRELQGPCIS